MDSFVHYGHVLLAPANQIIPWGASASLICGVPVKAARFEANAKLPDGTVATQRLWWLDFDLMTGLPNAATVQADPTKYYVAAAAMDKAPKTGAITVRAAGLYLLP
jgi:hypothetical protein